MSIYHRGEPAEQHKFREFTELHRKLAGCTLPSFRCKCCGQNRAVTGRKRATKGTNKDGYICASCLPKPQEAPPVHREVFAKARMPPKPEKPAKAAKTTLMTDEQVLECRAAYEFGCAKPISLARKYGVTTRYMRALLDYATRSKLIPMRPK